MPFQFLASVSAGGNLADLLQHLHVRTRVSPGPHPLTRVTARVHTLPTAAWHIATHFLCPCLTIFLHKFYITNHNWSFDFDYFLHWIRDKEELVARWRNKKNNLYYHNDADSNMHFICMCVPLTLTYFVMHFRFCSVKHFSTIVTSQSSVFTSSTGVSASVFLTTTLAVDPWFPMSFLSLKGNMYPKYHWKLKIIGFHIYWYLVEDRGAQYHFFQFHVWILRATCCLWGVNRDCWAT